jgi:hypothetical protein
MNSAVSSNITFDQANVASCQNKSETAASRRPRKLQPLTSGCDVAADYAAVSDLFRVPSHRFFGPRSEVHLQWYTPYLRRLQVSNLVNFSEFSS